MTGTNPNDQRAYLDYCNSMQNQMPNNQNNINLNNNNFQAPIHNTNEIYVNDPNQPNEVIPRKEETLYLNEAGEISGPARLSAMGMGNNNTVYVIFTHISGLKVLINAPKTMTFSQLFKNYVKKVGVPADVIGTKIMFFYNATELKVDSQEPISTRFKCSTANVIVYECGQIT